MHRRTPNIFAALIFLTLLGAAPPTFPRALWVWEKESWDNTEARKSLLEFARDRGITEFFLQVGYTGRTLDEPDHFRTLLRDCHAQGILVHALDGYPEAVLPENRSAVLDLARAVMAFNDSSKPEERFYGLHLDNEPYLLAGYGGRRKGPILLDYLELNAALASVLKGSGLVFGVDIPFWFDGLRANFRGRDRSVMEHVVDLVDNIGIMDYRNKAEGPDGLIAHAQDEIEAASRMKKRVYVGVETLPPSGTEKVFLWGVSMDDWAAMSTERFPWLFASRFERFRIATMEGPSRQYIGLSVPERGGPSGAFDAALRRLEAMSGRVPDGAAPALLREAEAVVRANREYEGFEPFYWPGEKQPAGFRAVSRGLPKITFAGRSPADMERELSAVAATFQKQPGFYGFAIHHYGSYRTFLGR